MVYAVTQSMPVRAQAETEVEDLLFLGLYVKLYSFSA